MTDHSDLIAELRAMPSKFSLELNDRYSISMRHANELTTACRSAAAALTSQSLSLSEARAENDRKDAEIERLKGLVAGIREAPARTIDAPGVSERQVLANARRICAQKYKRQPNWVLAMEAFGLGSTWARALCLRVGVHPDGNTMEATNEHA